MKNEGIIRNRAKIEAAVTSARAYLCMKRAGRLSALSVGFRRR